MIWEATTAEHVGQLVLAQAIDTVEGPLYVALAWGCMAAWLGFLVAANKNGFGETLKRSIYLLPALFAFICITWLISCRVVDVYVVDALEAWGVYPGDLGTMLTLCGSIGASLIVVMLLLRKPPASRDPS